MLRRRRQVFGKGSGQTPLHWAAESNHEDIVRLLLRAAPDSAGSVDEREATPSALARKEGHTALASELERLERERWCVVEIEREWSGATHVRAA